jgi:hypothetical protein
MTNPEIHLHLAVNLLRDAAESRRYPSGEPMPDDMVELHDKAAAYLETLAKTHATMDREQWAAEFKAANTARDVRIAALLAELQAEANARGEASDG